MAASIEHSLETDILAIMAFRSKTTHTLSEEVCRRATSIRDKCLQAEANEGSQSNGLQWRRTGFSGQSRSSSSVLPNRWKGQSSKPPYPKPTQTTPQEKQHVGRYVSKFQNQETGVEDKILNQVILNKLNKFSAANYNEIKQFLQQILDSDEKEFLQSFMMLVFKKAACEPTFCPLYAKMISELSIQYKTLNSELETLYSKYLDIFEEVSQEECKDYESFVQRNREKQHRLGYSQFLAELTSLGVLEQAQLEKIYSTILKQVKVQSSLGDTKQQVVDEYIDCLLRMTRAFQTGTALKLRTIRTGLATVCEEPMSDFLANRTSNYPGISKKASFAIMDCLDIFRGS